MVNRYRETETGYCTSPRFSPDILSATGSGRREESEAVGGLVVQVLRLGYNRGADVCYSIAVKYRPGIDLSSGCPFSPFVLQKRGMGYGHSM
jgi:hypothetical protein